MPHRGAKEKNIRNLHKISGGMGPGCLYPITMSLIRHF